MNEQIDLVYLLEKAALINEMIFRNRLLKGENHEVETELKKWCAASEGVHHPSIELYRVRFAYTEEAMLSDRGVSLRLAHLKAASFPNKLYRRTRADLGAHRPVLYTL